MTKHFKTRGLRAVHAEADLPTAIRDLNGAFASFRTDHNDRLAAVEAEVDRLSGSHNAALAAGGTSAPGALQQEREALAAIARGQDIRADLSIGGGAGTGGEAVFPQVSDQIMVRTFEQSGLAPLVRTVEMPDGDKFQEPQDLGEPATGWVTESQARPNLGTATLNLFEVPLDEIYTVQRITQRLLDDSKYDLGQWLENRIADKFAREVGTAIVAGDGTNKPSGLMTAPVDVTDNATRAWGTVRAVYSGSTSGFTIDDLTDMIYQLQATHRVGASWLMNSETVGYVRKLKDADGRPLWVDSLVAGQPSTLIGYPVAVDENMAAIGTDTRPVAFGNFETAYCMIRSPATRMLIDPYSSKPNVDFYATGRFGGALQNSDAVQFLITGNAP